jgi:outer membrane protein OmpA-like peptidoglycan-associated protein
VARVILAFTIALVFVTVGLGIRAYAHLSEERRNAAPIPRDIVVLANGTVVMAPDGSVAQRLVNWLEQPTQPRQVFPLGGVEFEGRSTVPTTATQRRVPTLVKMLSAYPDVKARFIGFTAATAHPADDRRVAIARANWAIAALVKAGIDPDRLAARAATDADVKAGRGSSLDRLDLELSQKGSSAADNWP